jgi:hypothetical protein
VKITQIDRDTCRLMRPEIDAALRAVAEKFGMVYKPGSATFTAGYVTFKAVVGADGAVASKDAEAFKRNAGFYGLDAADLGRTFTYAGKSYKIVGCAPKSYRFPILAETGGKTFKLPADAVLAGLGKPPRKPLFGHVDVQAPPAPGE